MARLPDLELFAERHGLILVTIEDLIAYLGSETFTGVDEMRAVA